MKPLTTHSILRLGSYAAAALTVWLFAGCKPEQEAETRTPRQKNPVPATVATEIENPNYQAPSARVSYAARMPSGAGASVISTSGNFIGSAIQVAVPDQYNKVKYLPGNDPVAIAYLKEKREEQEKTLFDAGPKDVDMTAMVAKRSISGHSRKIAAQVRDR